MAIQKRKVPLSVFIEFAFAGWTNQIMLVFACVFLLAFKSELITGVQSSYYFSFYELSNTKGKVTQINVIEKDEALDVYELKFEFTDEFGERLSNYSYTKSNRFRVGHEIDVEYVMPDPVFARIIGTDYQSQSNFGLLLFAFCLITLLGVPAYQLMRATKNYRLLKHAQQGEATFLRYEETSSTVNDEPLYRAVFKINVDSDNNEYLVDYKTFKREELVKTHQYTAFYSKQNPDKALVLTMMPGSVSVNQSGNIAGSSAAMVYLITPVIFILILSLA